MNRLQIAVFGAITIVFAVDGVTAGIFANTAEQGAMGAGWLILAIVDILWVLYFTSEEDSLTLHVFNMLGTGGLTPPSRRRRNRAPSVHNMGMSPAGNGYGGGYTSPSGGIGSNPYDNKMGGSFGAAAGPGVRSQGSFNANSYSGPPVPPIGGTPATTPGMAMSNLPPDTSGGINSPLMSPGNAGVGAGGGPPLPEETSGASGGGESFRARALYACTSSALSLPCLAVIRDR
jgi:SHO1 osmosensor